MQVYIIWLNPTLSALSLSRIYAPFPLFPPYMTASQTQQLNRDIFFLRKLISVHLVDAIPCLDLAPRYIQHGQAVGAPIPGPYRAARDW